ncbi:NAD(P)H-dependent oxidoreductase [Sinorhizobium sp. BG8]|uniref:NADPH-dependent FMN reductase n=1 Tax=Sinorhizobium sp. BG8 TaxID=2613773 RepID=UPI00193D82D3|nr:NAD(P)H-dependent oxidoreductase [Sinorhizobium sp. BG8]QRM56295.1 NAD(P)H-dependent oxidoreductase [Sinorhizobium sp. BG8]
MNKTLRLALIYGSAREGRFCDTVANWVLSELSALKGLEIVTIDPAQLQFSAAGPDPASQEIIADRVGRADAFLVVTPEYNHGYPAPLKAIIDSVSKQWQAKPVGFVSYGGISGGLRAVEQLRQVFAELHAVTIRDTVSLAHAWALFDSTGNPMRPGQLNGPLFIMLERLRWWADTLRAARKDSVYDERAA